MGDIPQAINPEELLSHSDFMRSIAMRLLKEESRADDAVQEAWLAAITHAPRNQSSIRNWLSSITRNFARKKIREESRRRVRETSVASLMIVKPTYEIVEQEANRRLVMNAVLSLNEPSRSTILYRYYDNMSPREIADLFGIPIKTVQSRIQRGLEQMRKKLRPNFKDRKSFCLILAPIAGIKLSNTIPAMATISGASTIGFISIIKTTSVLLLAIAGFFALLQSDWLKSPKRTEVVTPIDALNESDYVINSQEKVEPKYIASNKDIEEKDIRVPVEATGNIISGHVLDSKTQTPVKNFIFHIIEMEDQAPIVSYRREIMSDEEGWFSIPFDKEGSRQIIVSSHYHKLKALPLIHVMPSSDTKDLKILLDSGMSVKGVVKDFESGRPLADVKVGSEQSSTLFRRLLQDIGCDSEDFDLFTFDDLFVRTDSKGCFELSGLDEFSQEIVAISEEHSREWEYFTPDSRENLAILMKRGYYISGKVLDNFGKPLCGKKVVMTGRDYSYHQTYTTDTEGWFKTEPVRPNSDVYLWVEGTSEFAFDDAETKNVTVTDHDIEITLQCKSLEKLTWIGKVLNSQNVPIQGGQVEICLGSVLVASNLPLEPYENCRKFDIRQDGAFQTENLIPGQYWVRILLDKQRTVQYGWIKLCGGKEVEKNIHIPGGVISGQVITRHGKPFQSVSGVVKCVFVDPFIMSTRTAKSKINEDGSFEIRNLPEGAYDIQVFDGQENVVCEKIEDVRIVSNQHIKNIKIVVPQKGRVTVTAHDVKGSQEFDLSFTGPGEPRHLRMDNINKAKYNQLSLELDVGFWRMCAYYIIDGKRGCLERCFEIKPEQNVQIMLEAKELQAYLGAFQVKGIMIDINGSPIGNAQMRLLSSQKPETVGMAKCSTILNKSRRHRLITNKDGTFTFNKLMPGELDIYVSMEDGAWTVFQNIMMYRNSEEGCRLKLVLPDGCLSGILINTMTGKIINAKNDIGAKGNLYSQRIGLDLSDQIYIDLSDETSYYMNDPICGINGLKTERFTLCYATTGDYRIRVDAPGFETYIQEDFEIREGQETNLGSLELKPCGMILLNLFLDNGTPLKDAHLHFLGMDVSSESLYGPVDRLSNNCFLLDKLPIGNLELKITKPGYETVELLINLSEEMWISKKVTLRSK